MKATESLNIRQGCSTSKDAVTAARELYAALRQDDPALVIFYCSPEYDLDALGDELHRLFGDTPMVGCTTSGEITPLGYLNGALTGVSIASADFEAVVARIDNLTEFEFAQADATTSELVKSLSARGLQPNGRNTFGFLLIDGLSLQEEPVVSALYDKLGNIQICGGSAGDGVDFGQTYLYHEGRFHTDCALFSLVHTSRQFEVFKTQHFHESDKKLVVTEADPARRIVTEINGEPAGREYARMVGLDVDKLTPMIFANYPVVVRVGGDYYVRSIQKVNPDESLTLFCAIDEGIVLTVAKGVDMLENLEELFDDLRSSIGEPQLVLGCNCILRHLEMDRREIRSEIGQILADNNVIGFSTYGEQFNGMHVNQTFTGVAIGSRNARS